MAGVSIRLWDVFWKGNNHGYNVAIASSTMKMGFCSSVDDILRDLVRSGIVKYFIGHGV